MGLLRKTAKCAARLPEYRGRQLHRPGMSPPGATMNRPHMTT